VSAAPNALLFPLNFCVPRFLVSWLLLVVSDFDTVLQTNITSRDGVTHAFVMINFGHVSITGLYSAFSGAAENLCV